MPALATGMKRHLNTSNKFKKVWEPSYFTGIMGRHVSVSVSSDPICLQKIYVLADHIHMQKSVLSQYLSFSNWKSFEDQKAWSLFLDSNYFVLYQKWCVGMKVVRTTVKKQDPRTARGCGQRRLPFNMHSLQPAAQEQLPSL